jgi:hypothetical protein
MGGRKRCAWCGRDLERRSFLDVWQWRRARFCNLECYRAHHAARQQRRTCRHCGKRFMVRGPWERRRFCARTCRYEAAKKTGGTYVGSNGYTYVKDHARPGGEASKAYFLLHRRVVERSLGRLLKPGETIHHKNGDKSDNRPKNLAIVRAGKDHLRFHLRGYHGWLIPGRVIGDV